MQLRITEQVVIGLQVYGAGESVDLDDLWAERLIKRGVAVLDEGIREAISPQPRQARRATRRGNDATANGDAPRG